MDDCEGREKTPAEIYAERDLEFKSARNGLIAAEGRFNNAKAERDHAWEKLLGDSDRPETDEYVQRFFDKAKDNLAASQTDETPVGTVEANGDFSPFAGNEHQPQEARDGSTTSIDS